MKGDLISQSLTIVPMENHKGERLTVCPDCFGCGTFRRSRHSQGLPNGTKYKAGQALNAGDVSIFKRKSWSIDYGNCERCSGAGMAKVTS